MAEVTLDSLGEIGRLLAGMEKLSASDLHLKAHSAPLYRIHGELQRIKAEPYAPEALDCLILASLRASDQERLEKDGSLDFALSITGVGRFRVNVFRQRDSLSMAARRVNNRIPTTDQLNLPKAVNRLAAFDNGLVLVVGSTGSGKSTSLASIINRINLTRKSHILTIEDPIEYQYVDEKSFVSQREVGLDAPSFSVALKHSLRQDPDVILIGELRYIDTIETALSASETGHLVFATLHASTAQQSVSRILDFFPGDRQPQVRLLLAATLRAVLAQKLVPGCTAEAPRVPAVELLFVTSVIRKMIEEARDAELSEAMRRMSTEGMQDFNIALNQLVKLKLITEETAIEHSLLPEQLRMLFRGMVLNEDKGAFG